MQDGGIRGRERDAPRLPGAEDHGDGSRTTGSEAKHQGDLNRPILLVAKGHAYRKIRRCETLSVQVRNDIYILYGHCTRSVQGDRSDYAHALVQRTGIPVHETDVEVPLLRPAQPDFQFVIGLQEIRDIVLAPDEYAEGRIGRGYLSAVQEDIRIVVQTVEDKLRMLSLRRLAREGRGIAPDSVEYRLVHPFVIAANEEVFPEEARLVQAAGHGGRNRRFDGNTIAGDSPARIKRSPVTRNPDAPLPAGAERQNDHQAAELPHLAGHGSYSSFSAASTALK